MCPSVMYYTFREHFAVAAAQAKLRPRGSGNNSLPHSDLRPDQRRTRRTCLTEAHDGRIEREVWEGRRENVRDGGEASVGGGEGGVG